MVQPEWFGAPPGQAPVRRSTPWYRSTLLIALSLLCCWPVGIVLVWLLAGWTRRTKIIVTVATVVLGLVYTVIWDQVQAPRRVMITLTPTVVAVAQPATAPPASASTAIPAVQQAAPAPTAAVVAPTTTPPTTLTEKFVITGAGADGVNMRAEPSATAARVKLLKDGATLEAVGPDRDAGGRSWRNVKDTSDGATGWVAAEFVVVSQPTTAPPVANVAPTSAPPPATSAPPPAASAPGGGQQPSGSPKPAAPPSYDWVSLSQTSTPNRPRYKADVVVSADYGNEQVQAVLASAVDRAFREQRTAKAVVVFAYSSRAEVGKGADKGKAQASSDRLGWSGDGKFDTFADEGKIYMTVGNLVGFGDRQDIAVDRGQSTTAPSAPPAAPAAPKPAPAPKPAAPAAAPKPGGGTTCGSYASQAAAQAAYRANPSGLRSMDADDDGVACEGNPPPLDRSPVRR